ncbi:putative AC transposase [Mycena venus]|uniref:Putative AC transposase n=1 Tax=Mycena venus TaxID=2733690 RepID=A0A8H7CNU4_9AGAR|nr:putative AC transposase [Mycena venus]
MSRSRDNPDPTLILKGSRQRKQATVLNDPNNVAVMEGLVEQTERLSRKLPSTVPIAARDSHISTALALSGQDGNAASTFNRPTDGFVTLDEVPDEDDSDFQPEAGNDPISVHDSSSDESDATQCKSLSQSEQKKLTKKHGSWWQTESHYKTGYVVFGLAATSSRLVYISQPTGGGEDGMLTDINVQPIVQPDIRTNPSADVLHFSGKTFHKRGKDGDSGKLYRTCTICDKDLVADVSTNRRHYAKFHKTEYHAWCKTNDFESKLKEDVEARQKAQKAEELKKKILTQQSLDPHLREKPARPAPYTDELLLDAAIQWLIATDQVSTSSLCYHLLTLLQQPIDALTHPKFKEMMDIAARATEGVNLPNSAQTRDAIIKLFHDQMNKLKIRLHVCILLYKLFCSLSTSQSDAVTGMIHITCDAWQASNTDGYYAVTGHWMEETSPGIWVLREALLGFTRMNNAHHGIRLGQTLFKIVERLGITNRVRGAAYLNPYSNPIFIGWVCNLRQRH